MYLYVQYRPDGREVWQMVEAGKPLPAPSSFQTVLQISGDPEAYSSQGIDPETKIKYFGPMYFDLDSEHITEVITEARGLAKDLIKEGIQEEAISFFLSGKKGLHITIDPKVYGVTKPVTALPLVWKYVSQRYWDKYPSIDQSVYSLGKGRMWRSCGMERPDNGKFKVQITLDELNSLDEKRYEELCSYPRPEFQQNVEIQVVPSLNSFREAGEIRAKEEIKRKNDAMNSTVTVEQLRQVEGIPGCIEKLITEGDCDSSNWNQASMQLAAYIAARYTPEEEDEYREQLINPFLDNVSSSSRPKRGERERGVRDSLKRAFGGSIRFSAGGIISVIGDTCGECVICSKDASNRSHSDTDIYIPEAKVRLTDDRVYIVEDSGDRPVILAGLTVESHQVEYNDEVRMERTTSTGMLFVDEHGSLSRIYLPETEWVDERLFRRTLAEGSVQFIGSGRDLQNLYTAAKRLRMSTERDLRIDKSGLILYEKDGKVFPHYVGREHSFRKDSLPSDMKYVGPKHLAPEPSRLPEPRSREDMETVLTTLKHLFTMNEEFLMTQAIGWVCAATIKPYITNRGQRGFPLLNLCGSSHTGKSSTAYILLTLNGSRFRDTPVWNAEVDTAYPLEEMVVSSNSVVRLIEEANEHTAGRNWDRLLGILKSSWDEAGISRGTIGKGRNVTMITRTNTAPIMYLSEQPSTVQAIRTRGIECLLKPTTINNPKYKQSFQIVNRNTRYLEMLGKMLVVEALSLSYERITKWVEKIEDELSEFFSGRTLDSYVTVSVGLKFLEQTVEKHCQETAEFVREMQAAFIADVTESYESRNRQLAVSALDDIIAVLDQMALERNHEQHGLMEGVHYWKEGNVVYLDPRSVFPRYRRYSRGQGIEGSIRSSNQMVDLLKGEAYYLGEFNHPTRPQQILQGIDEMKLSEKGIFLTHFREQPLYD